MALTALKIRQGLPPGLHHDGHGLYLQVGKTGAQSWLYRYRFNGRLRHMGLGPLALVGLAEARNLAFEARKLARTGIDPIEQRRATKEQARLATLKAPTFDACATAYIESQRAAWKDGKNAVQWVNSLQTYASPVMGHLSVADIELVHVLAVLEPIWTTKTETAKRVRGRIESILAWAATRGYRTGSNPAAWRNHLATLLPKPSAVAKVEHLRALPYQDLPDFMAQLRAQTSVAARALEFLILTASRTGEALDATWTEIDLDNTVWTIPAGRMKAGREHRVPLVGRALQITWEMAKIRTGEYVFPSPSHEDKPLAKSNALLGLLKRMGRTDLTPHGCRSTFRDWCAEMTAFPHEVCEQALAHTITNAVERAYRRTDLFEKRRQLMAAWDQFCVSPAKVETVTPMRAKAG